jgi:hypothetical protein
MAACTYQLLSRALDLTVRFFFIALLALLRSMKPAGNGQPFSSVATGYDFFNRMKTFSGLHLEEDELVPAGRNAHHRLGFRFGSTAGVCLDRVELEGASPFFLPGLIVGERHIEDVRHTSRANHIVMIEKMAAPLVRVDGHVLLCA